MKKNVVIISSSLRKDSNSEALAKAFMNGAIEGGNEVEMISLAGKKIEFCKGCLACQKLGKCVISDDTNEIVNKMLEADVLILLKNMLTLKLMSNTKQHRIVRNGVMKWKT